MKKIVVLITELLNINVMHVGWAYCLVCACNFSTLVTEAGGLRVQGQHRLQNLKIK